MFSLAPANVTAALLNVVTLQQPTLPATTNVSSMSTRVYPPVYTTQMATVTHSLNYTAMPFVPRSTIDTAYGQTNTSVPSVPSGTSKIPFQTLKTI